MVNFQLGRPEQYDMRCKKGKYRRPPNKSNLICILSMWQCKNCKNGTAISGQHEERGAGEAYAFNFEKFCF
jgi:hypothetical protein